MVYKLSKIIESPVFELGFSEPASHLSQAKTFHFSFAQLASLEVDAVVVVANPLDQSPDPEWDEEMVFGWEQSVNYVFGSVLRTFGLGT